MLFLRKYSSSQRKLKVLRKAFIPKETVDFVKQATASPMKDSSPLGKLTIPNKMIAASLNTHMIYV